MPTVTSNQTTFPKQSTLFENTETAYKTIKRSNAYLSLPVPPPPPVPYNPWQVPVLPNLPQRVLPLPLDKRHVIFWIKMKACLSVQAGPLPRLFLRS